jgi:hypothetical protein
MASYCLEPAMTCNNEQTTSRIRALNDDLRRTLNGGRIMMTRGVAALGPVIIGQLIQQLRAYDRFDEGNDPYGEHDFGAFELHGNKFFWKIDYYDPSLAFGSEDPADPTKTTRVLTLMLAEEY